MVTLNGGEGWLHGHPWLVVMAAKSGWLPPLSSLLKGLGFSLFYFKWREVILWSKFCFVASESVHGATSFQIFK